MEIEQIIVEKELGFEDSVKVNSIKDTKTAKLLEAEHVKPVRSNGKKEAKQIESATPL
jgi:hypothetical protein